MAGRRTYRLGNLQLRIMKILWSAGSASVTEVQEALDGEPLAYTTVATMLRKLEERGLVRHEEQGRKYIYEPVVAMSAVSRSMADDLVERLFEGSVADAVSHLLEGREVDADELAELERLIRAARKR